MATKRKPKPKLNDKEAAQVVRVLSKWSPKKLELAELQADNGNLQMAVAVCEFLLSDDRVVAALSARVDQLLGLRPTFEASGDKRRSDRAVKALEADEDWWTAYPEQQLRLMLMWGLLLGVAPMKHRWEERSDHGNRVLPMPRFWHPSSLRQDYQTEKWTIRDKKSVEHEVVAGDSEWIMHMPFGCERPWRYGLWLYLGRWVLLKYYGIRDSGRLGARANLIVAESPEDSTKEQRRNLAEQILDGGDDMVVALSPGFKLMLLELAKGSAEIYKDQIDGANEAIATAIRGGNLTTNVEGGSRSAAEVQERTGDNAKLMFDAESITTTLHDQSLTWWAEFNYGDPNLAPWPVYPVEPEEDKAKFATTFKTAGEGLAIWDKLGFAFDEKALTERLGVSDIITGRPNPTRVDPAPGTPADGDAKPKPEKKDSKAARGFIRQLASGAAASENNGFIAGQLYVDAVVETAAEHANTALEPDITAIAAAIDAAESYDDLRDRLRALYETMSADDLNELVFRAMMLGELAGRAAVTEDG